MYKSLGLGVALTALAVAATPVFAGGFGGKAMGGGGFRGGGAVMHSPIFAARAPVMVGRSAAMPMGKFNGGGVGSTMHSPAFVTHSPAMVAHSPAMVVHSAAVPTVPHIGGNHLSAVGGGAMAHPVSPAFVAHPPALAVHPPAMVAHSAMAPTGKVGWNGSGMFHANGSHVNGIQVQNTHPMTGGRGTMQPAIHNRMVSTHNGDTNSPPPTGNHGYTNAPPPVHNGDTNSPPPVGCTNCPPVSPPVMSSSTSTSNSNSSSTANSNSNSSATNTNNIGVGATANAYGGAGGNGYGGTSNANARTGASTSSARGGNQSLVNNVQIPSQGNNSGNTTFTAIVPILTIATTNNESNVERRVVVSERRRIHRVHCGPGQLTVERKCVLRRSSDAGSNPVASASPKQQPAKAVVKKPRNGLTTASF